jgi:hypothetical protein
MEHDFGNLEKDKGSPQKDLFNERVGPGKVVIYHGSYRTIFSGQVAVLHKL